MTGRPWYPFYPDAYERDAGTLSYVQDSAYRRMLDHYYKSGEPLPLDKEAIYRACRAMKREERAAIDHALVTFFVQGDDGYHQLRADAEIIRAAEVSAKRSEAANKRHSKNHAIAEQLDTQSTATATIENSTLRVEAKPRAKPRRSLPENFPSEVDLEWSRQHWLGKGRADLCSTITEETAKFRDHHTGKATMSADWPGSWRTWTRNAMNFSRRPAPAAFPTATIHKVA